MSKIKSLFLMMVLLTVSMLSVNAAVEYRIDEGFGGIIFDVRNPGFSGISTPVKDSYWSTTSKHGFYSMYPKPGKNINVLINNYPALTPVGNFTLEFEYQPSTILLENVFSKLGTYDFVYNGALNTGTFTFYTGLVPTVVPINNITQGQINIIYLTRNLTHYQVWSNNVSQGIFLNALPLDININPLNLFQNSFTGLIDELEIYDYQFTLNDINNVVSFNQTTGGTGGGTATPTTIIGSQFPTVNSTIAHPVKFQITLLQSASCDMYIDNQYETSFTNTLAFNYQKDFVNDFGLHNYFLYCYTAGSNLTEISQTINFNVTPIGVNSINFDVSGSDFDINTKEMYLTTPCLKKGIAVPGINNGWNRVGVAPASVQFAQVVNGQATMGVPVGEHEFCLMHGRVNYDSLNSTPNYLVNEVIQNINLGKFNIPNSITQSFQVQLDTFDIYGKSNPKAWGTSWVGIISSLLAFGLGLLILIGGIATGTGQAVVIGGLLLLFSLGYQISNIVLGVLV